MAASRSSSPKKPIRRQLKRIPWWGWLALIAMGAWFGRGIILFIGTIIAFHPIPIPPLLASEPGDRAEAQLQDIAHFDHVRRYERSMSAEKQERFDSRIEFLRRNAGRLTDAEFELGLARAQAEIDNGHSNALATAMVEGMPRLPVRFSIMAGEVRVLRAAAGYEELLGARVLSIEGRDISEVLLRFRDAFGGNRQFFLAQVPPLLDTPAYLAAAGISAAAQPVTLEFELPDGRSASRTMAPLPADPDADRVFAGQLLLPWVFSEGTWSAPQLEGDPIYLRQPHKGYWIDRIAGGRIAYIALRTNLDDNSGETLDEFTRRVRNSLEISAPQAIVVDQRFNQGGDLTITHDLMADLPNLTTTGGRVYLLTSGNTFSAAIVNLASAKESSPERVFIVGEPIGDRLQFWAEGWAYDLPNSGFRARYSTGFYDLQSGCEGLFRCPWGSLHIFPIIIDDLDIDIDAPLDWDFYISGRDPALEAVLRAEGEYTQDS